MSRDFCAIVFKHSKKKKTKGASQTKKVKLLVPLLMLEAYISQVVFGLF